MASVSSGPVSDAACACTVTGLTLAIRQQEGVDTLPHRAVDESLAGQGLVQDILQGVAALNFPTGHDVVHQVALRMDVLGSSNLLKVETQWNSSCKQKDIQTEKSALQVTHQCFKAHSKEYLSPKRKRAFVFPVFWVRAFLLPVLQLQAPARLADSVAWAFDHLRARMLGKALPNLSQPVSPLPTIRKQVQPLPSSKQVLHTNSQGLNPFPPQTVLASESLPSPAPVHTHSAPKNAQSSPTCT